MLNIVKYQGIAVQQQLIIEQDNQSILAMIANGRTTGPTSRHINIRHFWLNDRLAQGEISMRYMPTNRRRNDYRPVNKAQRWKVILQAQTSIVKLTIM